MSPGHMIPGPDPGACPDCGQWRRAGMTHVCTPRGAGPTVVRLYAALQHERSCTCVQCSGGLNAVDDLAARLAACEADLREAVRERDELREKLGPDYHVYEQREDGWSVKHPPDCREEMLDCPIHIEASSMLGPLVEPGRYRVELTHGNLTFCALPVLEREAICGRCGGDIRVGKHGDQWCGPPAEDES